MLHYYATRVNDNVIIENYYLNFFVLWCCLLYGKAYYIRVIKENLNKLIIIPFTCSFYDK